MSLNLLLRQFQTWALRHSRSPVNTALLTGKANIFFFFFFTLNFNSRSPRVSTKCSDSINRHLSAIWRTEILLFVGFSVQMLLTRISGSVRTFLELWAPTLSFYLSSKPWKCTNIYYVCRRVSKHTLLSLWDCPAGVSQFSVTFPIKDINYSIIVFNLLHL